MTPGAVFPTDQPELVIGEAQLPFGGATATFVDRIVDGEILLDVVFLPVKENPRPIVMIDPRTGERVPMTLLGALDLGEALLLAVDAARSPGLERKSRFCSVCRRMVRTSTSKTSTLEEARQKPTFVEHKDREGKRCEGSRTVAP